MLILWAVGRNSKSGLNGLPFYRKSQLAYGERMFNGTTVCHKGEQTVITKLRDLRSQGLSYGKLAEWLNTNRIETKNGVGKWDRRTVFEILRRTIDTPQTIDDVPSCNAVGLGIQTAAPAKIPLTECPEFETLGR